LDIEAKIDEHVAIVCQVRQLAPDIRQAAGRMCAAIKAGGKILWIGNGGSAAECQHMAAELVGRFSRERRAFASIALTTDTSILTAVANDYGYENVFARQIEALCTPQDVVVAMSTSGTSGNIVAGIRAAKLCRALTIALTGENGGTLKAVSDICIRVPAQETARIQEAHQLIGHLFCEYIESELAKGV
jgi:D-sedoheptulose 7-phosphate isomerase